MALSLVNLSARSTLSAWAQQTSVRLSHPLAGRAACAVELRGIPRDLGRISPAPGARMLLTHQAAAPAAWARHGYLSAVQSSAPELVWPLEGGAPPATPIGTSTRVTAAGPAYESATEGDVGAGQAFSVAGWFRLDASAQTFATLASRVEAAVHPPPCGWLLIAASDNDTLRATVQYDDGTYIGLARNPIWRRDTAWHHVAMTYDADAVRVYLDGVFRGSGPTGAGWAKSPACPAGRLRIGGGQFAENTAVGWFDDWAFWRRALNAAEVAALYAARTGASGLDHRAWVSLSGAARQHTLDSGSEPPAIGTRGRPAGAAMRWPAGPGAALDGLLQKPAGSGLSLGCWLRADRITGAPAAVTILDHGAAGAARQTLAWRARIGGSGLVVDLARGAPGALAGSPVRGARSGRAALSAATSAITLLGAPATWTVDVDGGRRTITQIGIGLPNVLSGTLQIVASAPLPAADAAGAALLIVTAGAVYAARLSAASNAAGPETYRIPVTWGAALEADVRRDPAVDLRWVRADALGVDPSNWTWAAGGARHGYRWLLAGAGGSAALDAPLHDDGRWHSLLLTVDAQGAVLYADGAAAATAADRLRGSVWAAVAPPADAAGARRCLALGRAAVGDYAFAGRNGVLLIGSGSRPAVYDTDGRTLHLYQLHLSYTDGGRMGVVLSATAGDALTDAALSADAAAHYRIILRVRVPGLSTSPVTLWADFDSDALAGDGYALTTSLEAGHVRDWIQGHAGVTVDVAVVDTRARYGFTAADLTVPETGQSLAALDWTAAAPARLTGGGAGAADEIVEWNRPLTAAEAAMWHATGPVERLFGGYLDAPARTLRRGGRRVRVALDLLSLAAALDDRRVEARLEVGTGTPLAADDGSGSGVLERILAAPGVAGETNIATSGGGAVDLPALGIRLDRLPAAVRSRTPSATTIDYLRVSEALDRLADDLGLLWWVDAFGALRMAAAGDVRAVAVLSGAADLRGEPAVEDDRQNLRTRQIVIGGAADERQIVETFRGAAHLVGQTPRNDGQVLDGARRRWTLDEEVDAVSSIRVQRAGGGQAIEFGAGYDGPERWTVSTGAERAVEQAAGEPALTAADVLTVSYVSTIPIVVTRTSATAAVYGLVTAVEQDAALLTLETAEARCRALLDAHDHVSLRAAVELRLGVGDALQEGMGVRIEDAPGIDPRILWLIAEVDRTVVASASGLEMLTTLELEADDVELTTAAPQEVYQGRHQQTGRDQWRRLSRLTSPTVPPARAARALAVLDAARLPVHLGGDGGITLTARDWSPVPNTAQPRIDASALGTAPIRLSATAQVTSADVVGEVRVWNLTRGRVAGGVVLTVSSTALQWVSVVGVVLNSAAHDAYRLEYRTRAARPGVALTGRAGLRWLVSELTPAG